MCDREMERETSVLKNSIIFKSFDSSNWTNAASVSGEREQKWGTLIALSFSATSKL